ncbi:uncharacterized protein EHS24_004649 [Apiotrichum porosum]|uniref:Tetratricopeptide repeat protein n=1 Tax=Apiotrichum porosum TaxID=105984 RepID=A0A427Y5M6_9TREE|nr:uncharacterized protein EHS24_004649 [Apiotrichum porosum]RSH86399.1 hypothetical protein EHS24_004649 [Apiotrichum porosum]
MDKVEQDFATVESNASDKAREWGNVAFAKGDYGNALAAYTEAIEANIWDPKAWGNRSLTYLRLESK